jgi:hypothetical protein
MAISTQNEVEVIVGAANAAAILRSVQQHKPDCIILSLEVRGISPRICRTVLSRYPETLILAIGPKALTVYWHEVILRSARKECSLQSILDLVQSKQTDRASTAAPELLAMPDGEASLRSSYA